MGFAPPPDGPPPSPLADIALSCPTSIGGSLGGTLKLPSIDLSLPSGALSLGLSTPSVALDCCGFSLALPSFGFQFGLVIPKITFPFALPDLTLLFNFQLSCDLSSPLSVTAGVKFGGGRTPNADPDPDQILEAA